MRIASATLALALLTTAPAWAQTAAPAPAAAKSAAYTADTPIETIVADPAAKAALDKTLPNLAKHPAFDQFKSMSLRQLQPMSGGAITDEAVTKVDTDLKALPAKP